MSNRDSKTAGDVDDPDEPPPFGGSWRRVYFSVILYTCALILLLYWMTVTLNR
jgi:hypothetical protein